ncbi:hypothetical protein HLY00_1926 [Mycolicibacterium hippocampi]|uniref:Uncharacterized protein n=1 Tax=Mycolicibacterium hippocampi TaxID=659824 RepID=A0A850PVB1_9MYCO|nr:hypothetical protein [Mycolicibacterium hippocampi]
MESRTHFGRKRRNQRSAVHGELADADVRRHCDLDRSSLAVMVRRCAGMAPLIA